MATTTLDRLAGRLLERQVAGPGDRVKATLARLHAEELLVAVTPPVLAADGTVAVTVWLHPPAAIAASAPAPRPATSKHPSRPRWRLIAGLATAGTAAVVAMASTAVWLIGVALEHLPLLLGAAVLVVAVLLLLRRSRGGRHCPGCRG